MLDLEDLVIHSRGDVKNIGLLIVSQPCGSNDKRDWVGSRRIAVSDLDFAIHRDGVRTDGYVETYDGALQHVRHKYLSVIEIVVDGQIPGKIHICVFEYNSCSLFIDKQERTRLRSIVVRQLANHNKPALQHTKCCR